MADINVLTSTAKGVVPAFVAATAGGDTFTNDGRTYIHVKNGSAASINVTVKSPNVCTHGYTHDEVIAVAAGAEKIIGPFSPSRFNDQATGKVTLQYSAVATVTVAAARIQ